ncbi:hypothetical protein JW859_08975 [bacterium]|nr:hypothetical protein [bacterium]
MLYLRWIALCFLTLNVLLSAAGCSGDDDDLIDDLDANQARVTTTQTGGADGLGTYTIPGGTIVTSASVDAQKNIAFSVGEIPLSALSVFLGTAYGSAAFLPADAEFDRFVSLNIAANVEDSVVSVYQYIPPATSQVGEWKRVITTSSKNGIVKYETSSFGYFIVGTDNQVLQPPAAPADVAASDGTYTDRIRITWTAVNGAESYWVYQDTQSNRIAILGNVSSYDDMYVEPSETAAVSAVNDFSEHTYWVRAVNDAGGSVFSASDTGYVAAHDGGGGGDI